MGWIVFRKLFQGELSRETIPDWLNPLSSSKWFRFPLVYGDKVIRAKLLRKEKFLVNVAHQASDSPFPVSRWSFGERVAMQIEYELKICRIMESRECNSKSRN